MISRLRIDAKQGRSISIIAQDCWNKNPPILVQDRFT